MRFQGFIGPSYTLQSVNVDCQRTVNLYPEQDELSTGNEGEVASLVSTPGLKLLVTLPTGPVRGSYTDSIGQLWIVGGNVLYQVSSLWVATAIGTLSTSAGPVSISDNGSQLVVVDGPFGYVVTISPLGQAASGTVTAFANLAPTATLTIGGTTITFVASGATGNQVNIAASDDLTMINLLAFLQASIDSNLTKCTYALSGGNLVLTITAVALGIAGNSITLSGGSGALTVSGATLSGGGETGFAQITDPNFLGATQVDFMDGYLIFLKPNSEEFFISPINAVLPFDALDTGESEASPDNLVSMICVQENLYLLGSRSLEVFYDSGNTFPFDRIQGAVLEVGSGAAFSIAKIQNAVYWLGRDVNGRGVVYRAQGLQPQRISTSAIETVIAGLPDLSNARAWVYSQAGHSFYCLNLPGASSTWVFDAGTSMWHERAFLASGTYSRHLADCHAFAYNTNVVGDYSSGNVYALDFGTFTDNGNPIVRERTTPHVAKDMDRIFHSRFQLDAETGVGSDGSGQGKNPQVMLQWSNDGGHSWSNEHWTDLGKIGARFTRAIWRRLGRARDRVYRIRISDPIKVTLLGAEIEMQEGSA